MLGFLAGMVALAGPPTRVAATLEVGSGVADLEVSGNGQSVMVSDEAGGTTAVVDIATWTVLDVTPCESPAGIVAQPGSDERFWVGCLDGTIMAVDIVDGAIVDMRDPVKVAETAVLGLTASDAMVYALVEAEVMGAVPQLHSVSQSDLAVDEGSFPAVVGATGFQDIAYSGTGIYVTHGGSQITRVDGGSGAAAMQQQTVAGAATGDIVVLPGTGLLIAGGDAGVLSYTMGSASLVPILAADQGVTGPTALLLDLSQGHLLVADEDAQAFLRFTASVSTGMPSGDAVDSLDYPDAAGQITEMVSVDGYTFAGTSGGDVLVLTDRPWVEAESPSPKSALSGTEISIDFVADTDGDWQARLNAEDNTGGTRLASGKAVANEVSTVTFNVDGDFREGANRIRIVVEDSDGAQGHDTSVLTVDNPPTRVSLNSGLVGWGDGLVEVQIRGISDEDLSHYDVYVSTEPFSSGEYPTGGPGFVGAASDLSGKRLNLPRSVSAEPGQDKTVTVAPLTNGVTYYVAVRATDAAGQESQMSKVVSVKPQETYGAADLAGEEGGFGCSSSGAAPVGLLAWLGVAAVAIRRQPLAAVAALGLWGTSAQAASEWPQSAKTWSEIKGDTFEVRYGPITFQDESITAIFGDEGNNMLMLQFGPTIYDLLEIKGSVGYFHGQGSRISASGAASSQENYLNLYPVALDATFRLDVLPEQPVVPFAGAGVDYFFWREIWEGSGGSGRENISGGKPGWHKTYGAHILLDTFNQRRASKLQAVMGITDSYITVEYRSQEIGEELSGIKFSADTLTFGLKFDH